MTENNSVPTPPSQPPYQSISSQTDEPVEVVPPLQRDNPNTVNQTLQRLKHSQIAQVSTPTGEAQVRAATGLVSEAQLNKTARRRSLIGMLVIMILVVSAGVVFSLSGSINMDMPAWWFNQNNSSRQVVETTASEVLADLGSTQEGMVYVSPPRSADALVETNRAIFEQLGLEFDESIVRGSVTTPAWYVNQSDATFVMMFGVRDLPTITQALRTWETRTTTINPVLIPNTVATTGFNDLSIDLVDYRGNELLTYTIDNNQSVVIIGTSPQIIAAERDQLFRILSERY